ncbi:MAG TPA: hypothetical protein VJM33_02200 [Microthrixaceae bacterium]|nr:hypothetical protein [Microthrixaceae bacterium]
MTEQPILLDDDQRAALAAHASAIAFRLLGDHDAAERVATSTVDELARRIREHPEEGPAPMAWLAAAAVTTALDAEPSADGPDGPRRAALRLTMGSLAADERAVVALTLLCGYPRPEVAGWTARTIAEVDAVIEALPPGMEQARDLPRHADSTRRRRVGFGSIAAIVMLAVALFITNCRPFVDDADGRAATPPASIRRP